MKTLFALIAKFFCYTRTDASKTEIVLSLRPDGSRCAIWNDGFPIHELGIPRVSRASNVDYNEDTGKWEVTIVGEDKPRFSDPSRSTCIKWEIDYIHKNFPEILQQHFPIHHEH